MKLFPWLIQYKACSVSILLYLMWKQCLHRHAFQEYNTKRWKNCKGLVGRPLINFFQWMATFNISQRFMKNSWHVWAFFCISAPIHYCPCSLMCWEQDNTGTVKPLMLWLCQCITACIMKWNNRVDMKQTQRYPLYAASSYLSIPADLDLLIVVPWV